MNPIPKRYESASVEQKWRQFWEDNGVYHFQQLKHGRQLALKLNLFPGARMDKT